MRCNKCLKDKDLSEFYKRENGNYRLTCKECTKKCVLGKYRINPEQKKDYARQYYYKTKDAFREKKALRAKAYRIKNKDKINGYLKNWRQTEVGKASIKTASLKYNLNNKPKRNAKEAVRKALKHNLITKPLYCENCDTGGLLHAHHYKGYIKKYYLTIKWLCPSCHKKQHYA